MASTARSFTASGCWAACPISRRLAAEYGVRRVIITIAAAKASTIRAIVKACESAGLRALIIPGLYEILQGKVSISRFRDVDIEDLLGREPVRARHRAASATSSPAAR